MSFNDFLRLPKLDAGQANVRGQMHRWREPELCLAFWVRHVNVNPRLLAREEEQPELAVADNGGCHARDCTGKQQTSNRAEPPEPMRV